MKTKIIFPLFVAFAAVAIIFGASAFKKGETKVPDKNNFVIKNYKLTNPATPMDVSAYTEITSGAYDSLACNIGSATVCKIKALADDQNPRHPQQFLDNDSDDLPDLDGTVVTARILRANPE